LRIIAVSGMPRSSASHTRASPSHSVGIASRGRFDSVTRRTISAADVAFFACSNAATSASPPVTGPSTGSSPFTTQR
jgi:hypothetical protein